MGGLIIVSGETGMGPCDPACPCGTVTPLGLRLVCDSSKLVRFLPTSRHRVGSCWEPTGEGLSTGWLGARATSLPVCRRAEGIAQR